MDRIGRYKIARELGRGAMGVVYHAMDPNIGRPVAIKTIRLGELSNPQERARLRERLFREARSAGILSHPGIVTIYDVEQQGDLAYIAMEFVDGPTLDDVLARPHPVTRDQVFAILGQTAVALDYAHQKGIVHRDIKPANIMLTPDNSAKITDFGIAKIAAAEQFTMTGTIVGTPHYMSPEQVQGHPVDGRADQFSLAVIAYEMLTGEKPFTGDQLTTVVYKIVAEEPCSALRLNASLNTQVDAVLRKGLAKKPDARYRTCEEFVNALEAACGTARGWKPLVRSGGLSEPTVNGVAGAAAAAAPGTPVARPELPEPRRRRQEDDGTLDGPPRKRLGAFAVLVALLACAGVLGLIAWQGAPFLMKMIAGTQQEPAPAAPPAVEAAEPRPSPLSAPPAAPVPEAKPEGGEATETAAAEPAAPEAAKAPEAQEAKAEPEQPPETIAVPVNIGPEGRAPRPAAAFPVLVATSPPGATVTLDGRAETACKAPCSVRAGVGRHRVTVALGGYQTEHREVTVTGTPLELPLVSLRGSTGTLMVSTDPAGARVLINGRPSEYKTPAQVKLAPGTYRITVEKDGRQVSDNVEIRVGTTTYRKIPIGQ